MKSRHVLCSAALFVACTLALATQPARPPATATKPADNLLILTGTLETGVMAIGGETTGTTLTTSTVTYELEIKDAALKKTADTLAGKKVTITGTLTIKQGVEIGQRRIITVAALEAAKEAPATTPAPK